MALEPWHYKKTAPIYAKGAPLLSIPTVYYRQQKPPGFGWITEICLGERYAHVSPGRLFMNEQYRGSYIKNWHGGPSGSLSDIISWLSKAEYPEYTHTLWMELPEGKELEYDYTY